jgi:integrase
VVRRGKTPVLSAEEAWKLLDSIETTTLIGLRDRAVIGVMVYSFARVGATVTMRVGDYFRIVSGCGSGCTRKVASGTRCPAIQALRAT